MFNKAGSFLCYRRNRRIKRFLSPYDFWFMLDVVNCYVKYGLYHHICSLTLSYLGSMLGMSFVVMQQKRVEEKKIFNSMWSLPKTFHRLI